MKHYLKWMIGCAVATYIFVIPFYEAGIRPRDKITGRPKASSISNEERQKFIKGGLHEPLMICFGPALGALICFEIRRSKNTTTHDI